MSVDKESHGIPLLSLSETNSGQTVWTYQGNGTPGAVRLISVEKLLSDGARSIDLFEWINLFPPSKLHSGQNQMPSSRQRSNIPSYAAISHVWAQSDEVIRISKEVKRPLYVHTGNPDPHVISWHGLIQCATAAKILNCDYLWLDFLCLNQLSKTDKILQIKNMSRIYSNASAVLVMFGGVSAAQGIEHPTAWIDRAWTLQEATLCQETYGVIDWTNTPDPNASFSLSDTIITRHGSHFIKNYIRFTSLPGGIAIAPLTAFLNFYPGQYLGRGYLNRGDSSYTETEMQLQVRCLGTEERAISALSLAISAMWPDRTALRYLSAWRSMWLRTSTKSQDMVFSMMHLLDADIDVNYERKLEELLFELIDKTSSIPEWLLIGNRIPVMPNSGLIPILPTFTANSAPTIQIDGISYPAASLVNGDYGCRSIDIVIKSTSIIDGHNICARMFNV
ncbi:hypothetical protein M422DRAFT_157841, partial [Sphaerobolus stellatus SS14]